MKLEAVRHDRMRGGRNKFGPMYKRDRARKLQYAAPFSLNSLGSPSAPLTTSSLQVIRQRQLHAPMMTSPGSGGGGLYPPPTSSWGGPAVPIIKQEIQIREVSSLTSSPDSSPSPGHMNNLNMLGAGQNFGGQQKLSWNMNQHEFPMSPPMMNKEFYPMSSACSSGSSGGGASNGGGGGLISPGTAVSAPAPAPVKVPPPIREFLKSLDDQEWQTSLYSLLQSQTFNQVEVDLFELLCKVLDQNLFAQVDWARNSCFFKELKVDDQMKLLEESWSEMLILDHLHHRLHNSLPDETPLPNGQKFDLLSLALLGVHNMADKFLEITSRLESIKFDSADYVCLKFILLLNADVRNLNNRNHVIESRDQIHHVLAEYNQNCYSNIPDKYNSILAVIPELKQMAQRGVEFLYSMHIQGKAPHATLLMEMLLAKRRQHSV